MLVAIAIGMLYRILCHNLACITTMYVATLSPLIMQQKYVMYIAFVFVTLN